MKRQQDSENGQRTSQLDADLSTSILQQKLDITLSKLDFLTQQLSYVVNEVVDIKAEVRYLKSINSERREFVNSINGTDQENVLQDSPLQSPESQDSFSHHSLSIPRHLIAVPKGPFRKYGPTDRVVPRPTTKDLVKTIGGKAHSLQFTSSLYVDLITRELGPASETGLDYRAMVKEAVLITKAVLSRLKEVNNIDPNLRWSRVDPTIKLEAYRKLEAATEHLLPLKICSEFWGAHVLISNFWLGRRKRSSEENNSTNGNTESNPNLTKKAKLETNSEDNKQALEITASSSNTPQQEQQKVTPKAFSIPFLTHQ
ncbi:hypothetical protein BDF20DRAFT_907468 [Mycotypha africana]|uniref:uncharacterized protein n=1 Tax=Mycotypha africana TaxID=64632 RepID=UPI0022FFC8D7|nr:uncharacterized protein BDF20DRAFT_907468 [Mycotypha africana]KAI8971957.1 hypothetical protein BDF20DRAFT_907468 [Mycotypha africana]